MDYKKSLEIIENALLELKLDNKKIPIVVEGEKDIEALNKLDIKGTIIRLNSGFSLIHFF
jgi:5S rRNA maturation endonuclease (ribonuclease M5)